MASGGIYFRVFSVKFHEFAWSFCLNGVWWNANNELKFLIIQKKLVSEPMRTDTGSICDAQFKLHD